jgi:hypothetical protein
VGTGSLGSLTWSGTRTATIGDSGIASGVGGKRESGKRPIPLSPSTDGGAGRLAPGGVVVVLVVLDGVGSVVLVGVVVLVVVVVVGVVVVGVVVVVVVGVVVVVVVGVVVVLVVVLLEVVLLEVVLLEVVVVLGGGGGGADAGPPTGSLIAELGRT